MNYSVQVSAFDSEGRYTPLDPQDIAADTSIQAAQKVCGAGLVRHGPHDRLAATVWEKGTGNPYPVRFYRAR
jgi:hypothetical protein